MLANCLPMSADCVMLDVLLACLHAIIFNSFSTILCCFFVIAFNPGPCPSLNIKINNNQSGAVVRAERLRLRISSGVGVGGVGVGVGGGGKQYG